MPLETATYISDLNISNPANSDGLNQADDHMRLIKSAVKATFPNFTAAALASTQANLDAAVAAVVTRPNATVPAGAIMDFAMATAPAGWLECNGASVLRATYPDLFAAIGTTWGSVDGTHFNLPPDRYRRGRNAAAVAVGTLQASTNLTHTHTFAGSIDVADVPDHLHALGGSTGNDSPDHTHNWTGGGAVYVGTATGRLVGGTFDAGVVAGSSSIGPNTGGASARHTHTLPATTGARDRSLNHTHGTIGLSINAIGDATESRPFTMVMLTCIKT